MPKKKRKPSKSKWISERDTERKYRFPRELVAVWSGRPVPVPCNPRDRQIRRQVVVRYYCQRREMDCVVRLDSLPDDTTQPLVADAFAKDIDNACKGPMPHREPAPEVVERYQLISILALLCLVDDNAMHILTVLWDDLQTGDPVSQGDIEAEWDRYEANPQHCTNR